MASNDQELSIKVLKESIRLSEIRLAAQLQMRLALEARLNSSPPWLLALVIGLVTFIRGKSVPLVLTEVDKIIIVLPILAFLYSLYAVFVVGRWHYAGKPPSFLVSHIRHERKYPRFSRFNSLVDRCLGFLKANIPKFSFTYTATSSHNFQLSNSIECSRLLKLALDYEKSIAENIDTLKLIRRFVLLPNFLILFACVLWLVVHHS